MNGAAQGICYNVSAKCAPPVIKSHSPDRTGTAAILVRISIMCYVIAIPRLETRNPIGESLGAAAWIDLGALGICISCALMAMAVRSQRIRAPGEVACFIAFGIISLLASPSSFWPELSAAKSLIFLAVVLAAGCWCSACHPLQVLRYVYYAVVLMCLCGIVLGIMFPERWPLFFIGGYFSRMRLSLFGNQWGAMSVVTGVTFLIGRVRALHVWRSCQIFLFAITAASGSRFAFGMLVLAIAVEFALQHRRNEKARYLSIGSLSIVAAICVGALFLPIYGAVINPLGHMVDVVYGSHQAEQLQTLDGRTELFPVAVRLIADHPVVGWGVDGAREELIRKVPWSGEAHNGYLNVLLSAGVCGGLLFIAGLGLCLWRGVQSRLHESVNIIIIVSYVCIVALLAEAFQGYQSFCIVIIVCLSVLMRGSGEVLRLNRGPVPRHLSAVTGTLIRSGR